MSSPEKESDLETESDFFVNAVMVTLPASDQILDEIRRELKKNDTLKVVMQYVQEGWPTDKRKLCGPVGKYRNERGNLSNHDDLLLKGRRLEISHSRNPQTERPLILIHDAHQSISKTRKNTASSVWWCGLSRDIEKMLQNCDMFSKFRVEKIEPVRSTPFQN